MKLSTNFPKSPAGVRYPISGRPWKGTRAPAHKGFPVVILLAHLAAGCGGSDSSPSNVIPDFQLSVSPGSIQVEQGAQGAVQVTVTRSGGFDASVDLSLAGAPGGLTGSFNPNPAGGTQSTLTLSATAGLATGSYQVTVQGSGSPQATATLVVNVVSPPSTGGSTYYFCTPHPIWIAYRDGTSGPWVQAPGGNGVHTMNLQAERVSLAVVTEAGNGARGTTVYYALRSELQTLSDGCQGPEPTKSLSGSVAGLGPESRALISLGSASTAVQSGSGPGFNLSGVPDGPQNLLAASAVLQFGGFDGTLVPEAVIVRRGVDAPDGTTLPLIDFSSGEAFAPATANLEIANATGEPVGLIQSYLLGQPGSGAAAIYGQDLIGNLATSRTIYGLPADRRQPGELHMLVANAAPMTGGLPVRTRSVVHLFSSLEDRTVTFGPDLGMPTLDIPTTSPYPRPRMVVSIQPEYNRTWMAGFTQTAAPFRAYSVIVSSGYLQGGATVTLQAEDFSGVSGWQNDWALRAGESISWQLNTSGWDGPGGIVSGPTADGSVRRAATRTGTMDP